MMTQIPGIRYAATPRAGGQVNPRTLGQPPKLIVVHCTDNTASAVAEAGYAANRLDLQKDWTSAHAYVDAGGVIGSLDLGLRAWAAFSWANGCAWHVELCGREDAVPDTVQRIGAALVRQLCLMAGVPMEHVDPGGIRALHDGTRTSGGITGHRDITLSGIDSNNHTDPGANFDWARFIAWVREGDAVKPEDEALVVEAAGIIKFNVAGWLRDLSGAETQRAAANEARDNATLAAIKTLAAGGADVDTAAVIARINEVAAAESNAVARLQADLTDARRRLAAALAPQ
jgi:hypothetical protein